MTENILLLGAGAYYKKCIASAREVGYRVICIDRDPQALAQDAADEFYPVDFSHNEEVLALAREKNIRAIVPLNDYGVQTAAYVAKHLGLKGISEESAHRVTDKYEMRLCWQQAQLPNPEFQLVADLNEAKAFAERVGFPVIFKPANSLGGGSRGVQTAHSIDDIETAFHFAQSVYANDSRVLIEQCVHGIEHSAEVVVVNGIPHVITVSDKVKTPYPYRVDEQVIYPTCISGAKKEKLDDVICQAVQAVGITIGAAHIELCSTENGPVLFEIGARCGGGATADPIVPYVTGYSYFQNIVRLLAGETIPLPDEISAQQACIYGFFTVENQHAFKDANRGDFVDWEIFPRDTQPALTRQGGDRLGYYIYNGTPTELSQQSSI
jgi:biotin carboxylase